VRFIEDYFPLIVTVSANQVDAKEVQQLSEGFERFFNRGERYAVLNLMPADFKIPDAGARTLMAKWVSHPRVRDFAKRLCVGAATVQPNLLYRVAFNIVMAFDKPATHIECVATLERGIDHCLESIRSARLSTTRPFEMIRYELIDQLKLI
jgi:hypothetical protein